MMAEGKKAEKKKKTTKRTSCDRSRSHQSTKPSDDLSVQTNFSSLSVKTADIKSFS